MFLLGKNQSCYDKDDNVGYDSDMDIRDQIRLRREELGRSQAELGRAVGISQAAIDKIESGKTQRSRFLPQILASLDLPQDLLFKGSQVAAPQPQDPAAAPMANELRPVDLGELIPIKIAGKVKAGEFIAIEDLGDWDEPEIIHDVRDPRFPDARHLGFQVEGDSMNALKPRPIMDGDKLSALSYEDIADRYPLRDGMIVVVERTRHGGHEREWSVKQLEIYEDRVEFHPRSTNARYKPIVVKREHQANDGVTVEIIAIVRRLVAEFNL